MPKINNNNRKPAPGKPKRVAAPVPRSEVPLAKASPTRPRFTEAEEARINAEVARYQDLEREQRIVEETRRRIAIVSGRT